MQGLHHVAQKFINRCWPLKSESLVVSPCSLGRRMSGSILPSLIASMLLITFSSLSDGLDWARVIAGSTFNKIKTIIHVFIRVVFLYDWNSSKSLQTIQKIFFTPCELLPGLNNYFRVEFLNTKVVDFEPIPLNTLRIKSYPLTFFTTLAPAMLKKGKNVSGQILNTLGGFSNYSVYNSK